MHYTTWLQDEPMLTKITAIDLTPKEAKYHGVCIVKYQSEAEPTLEGRKTSLNVAFLTVIVYGTNKEKLMLKCLILLRFILNIGFWKKEVCLIVDINSYYLALLQDTADTDLKGITTSAQKLDARILKCYPEKIKIGKGKASRGNIVFSSLLSTEEACRTQYSQVTSDDMQIRDVAVKIRQ